MPEYSDDELSQEVSFEINDEKNSYSFSISKVDFSNGAASYKNLDNAITVVSEDINIYIFEHDGDSLMEFTHNDIYYYVCSKVPVPDMVKIAESIK